MLNDIRSFLLLSIFVKWKKWDIFFGSRYYVYVLDVCVVPICCNLKLLMYDNLICKHKVMDTSYTCQSHVYIYFIYFMKATTHTFFLWSKFMRSAIIALRSYILNIIMVLQEIHTIDCILFCIIETKRVVYIYICININSFI